MTQNPKTPETSENQLDIIPIRKAFFSPQFWDQWDRLMDRDRAAFTLGWISELELAVRGMSGQIQRINDHLEDDGK